MTAIGLRLGVLCVVIASVWTGRDEKLCRIRTQSCGLIPPPLPRNFEFQGEVASFPNLTLSFQEVYFDNKNIRGKLVSITNKVETHMIFDYETSQIIQYIRLNPGNPLKRDPLSETCVAVPMESSPWRFVFGYLDGPGTSKHSRMYNSYQALRYGDEFQYAAAGVEELESRGLKANVFASCVYDSGWDATMKTKFYFTTNKTAPSSARFVSTVNPTVPLKILMNGTINVMSGGKDLYRMKFDTQQSLSWFSKNPDFGLDTFKIPQWLYCKNFRGSKDFPELPPAFSVDLEITSFTQDLDGKLLNNEILLFYKIWYNVERGIARRDFTPLRERDTDIYSKFNNLGPVSTIYDFNSGVVYVIHKQSGRCYDKPINSDEFFVTSKDKMHVRMASPEEFLYMNRDTLEYKGKDVVRDIDCDVWAGKYSDPELNLTSFLETSISTEGWHDDLGEFGVPVRHTVITRRNDPSETLQQTVVENNFFRFRNQAPSLQLFTLHNTACMDTIEKKYLGMTLSITPDDLEVVKKYSTYFLEAVRYYLADVTMMGSALRVQSLRIEKIDNKNMVTFALLEKTKLKVKVPPVVLGADLKTAIENLRNYVDSGKFLVKFTNPELMKEMTVMALPNGLVMFKTPIETYAERLDEVQTEIITEKVEPQFEGIREQWIWEADEKPKKVVQGMSKGGLAGLSIGMLIIGIGVGIALMYLYFRRFGNAGLEDSYAMQSKR